VISTDHGKETWHGKNARSLEKPNQISPPFLQGSSKNGKLHSSKKATAHYYASRLQKND
jgi:hypothetical protein